jgi:hypothetical protein
VKGCEVDDLRSHHTARFIRDPAQVSAKFLGENRALGGLRA